MIIQLSLFLKLHKTKSNLKYKVGLKILNQKGFVTTGSRVLKISSKIVLEISWGMWPVLSCAFFLSKILILFSRCHILNKETIYFFLFARGLKTIILNFYFCYRFLLIFSGITLLRSLTNGMKMWRHDCKQSFQFLPSFFLTFCQNYL